MHNRSLVIAVPADELRMYRAHTMGVLRRYFRMSLELGRLPSLVGREFFRARVSSYPSASFEDLVIFVTDVERCVEQLEQQSQLAIARVIFQEYTVEEAGRMLGWNERTVRRTLAKALDQLAQIFLERSLLRLFPLHEKSCQEAKKPISLTTH